MMYSQNEYVSAQLNRDSFNAAFAESEKRRMLRQAGLFQANSAARLLSHGAGALGRMLVALGQRLVRVETASYRSSAGWSAGD